MSQKTSGLYSALSFSLGYNLLQALLGAKRSRDSFARDYLDLEQASSVVDVGCGTGELLNFVPDSVQYYGYDISETYIETARRKFGSRGIFFAKPIAKIKKESLSNIDRVIASGVLHHLNDSEVIELFTIANKLMKASGKFVSIDPCFTDNQSIVSKFLVSHDRGQNVRNLKDYEKLANMVFSEVSLYHRNNLLNIPYDHAILVCS